MSHFQGARQPSLVCDLSTASPAAAPARQPRRGRVRRRDRVIALSLVVATASPVLNVATWAQLLAEEPPAVQTQSSAQPPAATAPPADLPAGGGGASLASSAEPMGNKERLQRSISEYNKAQYEESLADLQLVDGTKLGDSDRKMLGDYLARAEDASNQRKSARAEYEQGDQALAANDATGALVHYKTAINNRFVDDGTKSKSREQMAVANSMLRQAGDSLKTMYAQGVSDYKSGDYGAAREKFTQLQAANYKSGLFQKSPTDFLRDIDKKMPVAAPMAAPQPDMTAAAAPAPATPNEPALAQNANPQGTTPAPSGALGGSDVSAAPPNVPAPAMTEPPAPQPAPMQPVQTPGAAEPPTAANPAPVAVDPTAQTNGQTNGPANGPGSAAAPSEPAMPQPAPAAAPGVADNTATAPTPSPSTEAVAQGSSPASPGTPDSMAQTPNQTADQSTQANAEPVAPMLDAKSAYKMARQQYRSGDWIAARKNFEIARDQNYKPGLFEDAPAKYLARMDAKEQHDGMQPGNTGPTPAVAADDSAAVQKRQEAQDLVSKAEEARGANRLDESLALYSRALELDSSNTAAQSGRDGVAKLLGKNTDSPDPLAVRENQILAQRQSIQYSVQSALGQAREAESAQHFNDAQTAIEQAKVARALNPGIFQDGELRQFDQQIADAQSQLSNAIESSRLTDAERARAEAERQIAIQRGIADSERRHTVADLVRESRRLTTEGKYREAVGVLDQILKLDPQNDYALGARPLVEDRSLVQTQKQYINQYDREVIKQYNDSEEKLIPYSDILQFPTNWPDLSALRDKTVATERGERAEDQAVLAQLDRKLPEVNFNNQGFADVIEFLRDVTSANIFVNWRALTTAGIDKDAPVTARLRDVKFSKALETILRDVGGGTVKLGYTIDEGVITISTEEDLSANQVTRVYDIRDLIINVTDFDPPQFQLQSSSGGKGSAPSGNLFSNSNNNSQNGASTREQLVDQIVKLIEETVAADTWKDTGGGAASIRELQGQLIVTQTPENQRQLVHLLEQLRETRAIQITVETRFLTVQRNFLEEIGVDFDVFVPAGQFLGNVGAIGINNNTSTYTGVPALTTNVPGNIATELSASASTAGTGVPPNFSIDNGAGGAVTFLDDFQVSLLLRATQISQNTTTLTAPRLTLFNGQRAYVQVATQTAYVSDLTPIVGTNAVAFDPQVSTINSGVQLAVQATVSADRKYVTLTLHPYLTRLRALVPFPVVALSSSNGINGGQVAQTAFLQVPTQDSTEVATTVSVPDGGTLLLGGQSLASEVERESGVPVLSKIPFLKRLFTNTSNAKDEQVLLILVKPTIVIQREREAEQFPLLSSKTGG